MHVNINGRLSAAVADAGTLEVSYPARPAPDAGSYNEGDFYGASGLHKLVMGQALLVAPDDFSVAIDATDITLTNKTGATWPAGTDWKLEVQIPGKPVFLPEGENGAKMVNRAARADTVLINLGAPDTLVTNAVMAQQNRTDAGALVVNGTLASGGVAVLDVPRNIIADSGGADTAVLTVTGKDEYGNTMIEALTLNGTTAVSGKKAFKQITGIEADDAVANTAFIGTGDVLGLPVFLPSAGYVLKELENGTAASAGTFVAGDTTSGGSTATTGDVRGTYDANSAADAEKVFQLIVSLPDPNHLGMAQYAG